MHSLKRNGARKLKKRQRAGTVSVSMEEAGLWNGRWVSGGQRRGREQGRRVGQRKMLAADRIVV